MVKLQSTENLRTWRWSVVVDFLSPADFESVTAVLGSDLEIDESSFKTTICHSKPMNTLIRFNKQL